MIEDNRNYEFKDETITQNFDITKQDNVFVILVAITSVLTSVFGIFGGFKSGFTVTCVLLLGLFTFYLKNKENKIKIFPLTCVLLSLGIGASFIITTNVSVRFWSFVVTVLLYLVWFTSLTGDVKESGDLGILKKIFAPFFKGALFNLPVCMKSLFVINIKNSKKFGMIVGGLAVSVPFVAVVVSLLISSDEAFSGMVTLIFGNIISGIFKIVFGLGLSVFIISYGLSLKKEKAEEIKPLGFDGVDSTFITAFLSTFSVCYLAYLFSQLAYFFSAFKGFLPENYKIADYARRGFFEMSIIAAINFALIFFTVVATRKKDGKLTVILKILCTFIGVFTLIIISTAISKMVLYIGSFGMTVLRLTTSAFMVFLAVAFISLILRIYIPKIKVIRTGIITAAIVLLILGTVNVNSVVAKYNYEAYKHRILKQIDVGTLYDVGAEGVPYLVNLSNGATNSNVKREATERLAEIISEMYELSFNDEGECEKYIKKYDSIGEFSIPTSRAYKILDDYIEKNPNILVKCSILDFEDFS